MRRILLAFAWAKRAGAVSTVCGGASASRVDAEYRRGEETAARRRIRPSIIGLHARRSVVRRLAVSLAIACCSCGAASDPELTTVATGAGDPLPHTPPPQTSASTGQPVGLAVSGGFHEARGLASRFVEAVLAADADALAQLLDTRVARVQPRLNAATTVREAVLIGLLHPGRRRQIDPGLTLPDVLEADAIRAGTLASEHEGQLPQGLEPTDVLVTLPLTDRGKQSLGSLLSGWSTEGRLIVRPGSDPRIVGL